MNGQNHKPIQQLEITTTITDTPTSYLASTHQGSSTGPFNATSQQTEWWLTETIIFTTATVSDPAGTTTVTACGTTEVVTATQFDNTSSYQTTVRKRIQRQSMAPQSQWPVAKPA